MSQDALGGSAVLTICCPGERARLSHSRQEGLRGPRSRRRDEQRAREWPDEAGRATGARLSGGPRSHTASGLFSVDKELQKKGKAEPGER